MGDLIAVNLTFTNRPVNVSEELAHEGRFEEAAAIFWEVLQDVPAAVDMLIKGNMWGEAIRVVSLRHLFPILGNSP